jgi:hypothetical protein
MIIGAEIPILLSLSYPALNYIWWFPKIKKTVENEILHIPEETRGIEVYDYHKTFIPPSYINVNNVSVPVGGYFTTECRFLCSNFKTISNSNHTNYIQINNKEDLAKTFLSKSYINTNQELIEIFEKYSIPTQKYRITLPLKVHYYHYKQGFYAHQIGTLSTNRDLVLKDILWYKRLPFSLTVPLIGGIILQLMWADYMLGNIFTAPNSYPPFHIKKIYTCAHFK